MFQNQYLKNHLQSSYTVQTQTALIAEWNMNIPSNIYKLGNYRYRPSGTTIYNSLPNIFDPLDFGNFYTGATDADITIENGLESNGTTPLLYTFKKDKEKLYYSLEDCIKPFRPRSGIGKASFFPGRFLSHPDYKIDQPNIYMYLRPRYYMPTKDDQFKYWRSYRTETDSAGKNIEYGISKTRTGTTANGVYEIEDSVPFVVYKEEVPANRLILKVQTNIGDIDLGPFKNSGLIDFDDPFFGDINKTVPQNFTIQYLDVYNKWINAYDFNLTSTREDGTPIFNSNGYLSLQYGLVIPSQFKNNFLYVGKISSLAQRPEESQVGYAYLLQTADYEKGMLYIWNGTDYTEIVPEYSWSIGTENIYENTQFVTKINDPEYFYEVGDQNKIFREFVWIKGIRIVVKSMNVEDVPFELIEFSPRLAVDFSDRLIDLNVKKSLADLANSSLPVGGLLASTGSLTLFDDDNSFNQNNIYNYTESTGSIIAKYLRKNIQFKFYDVVKDVNSVDQSSNPEIANFYVPIKVLYSEGIPQTDSGQGTISLDLRDFFFYLESQKAPEILLPEVSLSQAVAILLDSIGFSNYVFKRLSTEKDPVIPFFFVPPEKNVAEILIELSKATQSAMFFDEYNNFVVMTKGYLLDNTGERPVDITLYGSELVSTSGSVVENLTVPPLTNIVSIASQDQKVYNQGNINYTARYIQRSYGTLKQASLIDREKTWIYKPVLLWEVSGDQSTKTLNDEKQSKYTLSAMPLNSDISSDIPKVVSRQIINNTIDFGESIYFISRYQGYFYASGEIIKYDAVQYNITGVGNVWISSNLEYQRYFASLPFNGKIYPTGLVRIYCEPYYEQINGITYLKNGDVVSHGRGQFNTEITSHSAGLPDSWSSNDYVAGCFMDANFLYTTSVNPSPPSTSTVTAVSKAGVNKDRATRSQRNGIIKNFLSSSFPIEANVGFLRSTEAGSVQSSALVFRGPDFENTESPKNFVTYVWKELDKPYKHVGTRMRIIGKVEASGNMSQTVFGGMTYYDIPSTNPGKTVTIGGGSGGICIVNPNTNNGYYLEIAALSSSNLTSYLKTDPKTGQSLNAIDNIMFYKVKRNSSATSDSEAAVPIKMWGGIANIIVDDGNFVGQYRMVGEENPTVYDIAIEYVDINEKTRVFYLYVNQKLVQVVTDTDPIPLITNTVGLFVRGTSKCMFENIYGLSQNYSENSVFTTNVPIASVFGDDNLEISASEAMNKYALSGMIQKTYLSGVGSNNTRKYDIFYDEFGTTMRECAYFNIKFDRAYPALFAKISPTFNRLKGYTISGFTASSYGAEFLVFNCTDSILSLDETSGNYLRIQGIAFTQDTTTNITIDDYYKKKGNFSDPELSGSSLITSPFQFAEEYDKIRNSRIEYGVNEFSLDSLYIQTQDHAEELLGWIAQKNLKPRKAIGIEIFSTPTLQLGDIVNIYYKSQDSGLDLVVPDTTRMVVYNIEYNKNVDGPSMTIYLSEV